MLTNMESRYLVATLMFIKSPRTTFSCEVLAFHAPVAGFVLFIAYGVDQSFVRPARGPLFTVSRSFRDVTNMSFGDFLACALCFRGKF